MKNYDIMTTMQILRAIGITILVGFNVVWPLVLCVALNAVIQGIYDYQGGRLL